METSLTNLLLELEGKVKELTSRVAKLEQAYREREIHDMISRAIAMGRITMDSRDFYEEIGQQENGIEQLREFFLRQPVITRHPGIPASTAHETHLTSCEQKLCQQLGITEDEYLRRTRRNG